MIVNETRGNNIVVRRRDPETLKRITEKIPFLPYIIVQEDCGYDNYEELRLTPPLSFEKLEETGVYGEKNLIKLNYPAFLYHKAKKEFKERGIKTWENNITLPNKALFHRLNDGEEAYPNYTHQKFYFDMEWAENDMITVVSIYDSYTQHLTTWVNHGTMPRPEIETNCQCFTTELGLLKSLVSYIRSNDPDMLIGWALQWADIRMLADRLKYHDIDPSVLSPLRKHKYRYQNHSQPIPGLICFDLMTNFVKLWTMKNGQLPSEKLDDVAWEALRKRKAELPDGHNTYYTDLQKYVEYNKLDVELLVELDELLNCSEYFLALQHLVQCEFDSTPFVTMMASCLFKQDPEFTHCIPSLPQFDYIPYEGADIQEPEPGLYTNTAILDIKQMYHSNVNLNNICWTTIDSNGKDVGNGIKFSQDKQGVLGRTMDKISELRDTYKESLNNTTSKEGKIKWDIMQFAAKSLVASLYGVAGDSKYSMYHPDVASSITYTSRKTLFKLRDECKALGYEVSYGHTDSIFTIVPSVLEAKQLVKKLNAIMDPIEVEFERYCDRMLLKAKNRYAGRVVWDGRETSPYTYVKGLEAVKQARLPKVMKDTIGTMLEMILDGKPQNEVDEFLIDVVNNIRGNQFPLQDLSIRATLKRKLSSYKVLSEARAAADWANRRLHKQYDEGCSFYVTFDTDRNYVAFDKPEDLEDVVAIGYQYIIDTFILKKAQDIYNVLTWSTIAVECAARGLQQLEWI